MLLAWLFACSSAPAPAAFTPANVAPAVVGEVLHGDGRAYVHLTEATFDFWVSIPDQELAAGDALFLGRGPLQHGVASAALGRTFADLTVVEEARKASPEEVTAALGVAEVPGGTRIAAIFADRAGLAGHPVRVAGRVVKANKGIFGKNWYHLQDGTGAAEADDLAVTTQADFALGDLVVAQAPLVVDRDLGFGYFFPAILEEATVVAAADVAKLPAIDAAPSAAPAAAAPAAAASAESGAPAAAGTPGAAAAAPAPAALTPVTPRPDTAGLPAAPSLTLFGLPLGTASPTDADAWFASRKLPCTPAPALRRATVRYECTAGLAEAFPERATHGKLTTLLLSRTDTGPIHYLSLVRQYSVPMDAAEEYTATLGELTVRYAAPAKDRPLDPAKLSGVLARAGAEWHFADLDVSLSLFKGASGTLSLTEVYAIPGVEEAVGARAGSRGHGDAPEHPSGWNPHVIESADHPAR